MPAAVPTLLVVFASTALNPAPSWAAGGFAQADVALPAVIEWKAPAGCPNLEQLRAEIVRLAGPLPARVEAVEARATVERAGSSGWTLSLTTRAAGRSGERELAGADCESLMRAAALVVALMLNPSAGEPEPPASPVPAPPPAAPVGAAPTGSRGQELLAGADVLLSSGLQPGAAGLGAGLRLGFGGWLSGELRASLWTQRQATSPGDSSTGGRFDLSSFAAAACGRSRRAGRVSPGLCLGVELLRAHASGFGVSDPGAATGFWESALLEANVGLRIWQQHALRLALAGLVPLGKPRFALAGIGPVFEPSAIAGRAALGWELHF